MMNPQTLTSRFLHRWDVLAQPRKKSRLASLFTLCASLLFISALPVLTQVPASVIESSIGNGHDDTRLRAGTVNTDARTVGYLSTCSPGGVPQSCSKERNFGVIVWNDDQNGPTLGWNDGGSKGMLQLTDQNARHMDVVLGPPIQFSGSPAGITSHINCLVVYESGGKIHIERFVYYPPTGTMTSTTTQSITSLASTSQYPNADVNDAGDVALVWYDFRFSNQGVNSSITSTENQTLGPISLISTTGYENNVEPDVAISTTSVGTPAYYVHFAYQERKGSPAFQSISHSHRNLAELKSGSII